MSRQLETVTGGGEPVHPLLEALEVFFGEETGDIHDLAAGQAARVVVWIRPGIITGRAITIGQLRSQAATHKRFQALVHRGEGDPGDPGPDSLENLVGVGMAGRIVKETVHCCSLFGETVTGRFQDSPKAGFRGEGCG
jgi:hypothetical protein